MPKKKPHDSIDTAKQTKLEMREGAKTSRSWGLRGARTRAQKAAISKSPFRVTSRPVKVRPDDPVWPISLAGSEYEALPVDPITDTRLPKQVIASRDLANSYFDPVIIPRWKALELGLHGVTYGQS